VLTGMGTSMMGTGEASGENRARIAAEEAIANPLLDNVSLKGAKGLLLSITGGKDLTLFEVDEAASRVRREVDPDANIIVGATFDESLTNRIRVSIVASGMDRGADSAVGTRLNGLFQATGLGGLKGRARRAIGPQPPRPPMRDAWAPHGGEDDLTRALSEAMHRAADDEAENSPAERDRWRAADGTEFEEGPPEFGSVGHPPVASASGEQPAAPRIFQPAPPIEVKRSQQRRVPDLEDFPPLGQHEYRSRMGSPSNSEPAGPRKASLIERLIGVRQRSADSRNAQSGSAERPHGARSADDAHSHPDAGNGVDGPSDDVEVPVFFDRSRKA
jgi:cell division protein FtsZ